MYILLSSVNRRGEYVPQKQRVKSKGHTAKVNPLLLSNYSLSKEYSKSLSETILSDDKKHTVSMLRMVKDAPFVSMVLVSNGKFNYTSKVRITKPSHTLNACTKLGIDSSINDILSNACLLRGKVTKGTFYLNVKLSLCNEQGEPLNVLVGTNTPNKQKVNIHKVEVEKVIEVESCYLKTGRDENGVCYVKQGKRFVSHIFLFSKNTMKHYAGLNIAKYITINTEIAMNELFND